MLIHLRGTQRVPVEGKKDEGTNISWQFFDSKKQINDASLKKRKNEDTGSNSSN